MSGGVVAAVPEQGQIVEVRHRRLAVADVARSALPQGLRAPSLLAVQHLVTPASVKDDAFSEELQVIWELEPGARVQRALPVPTGFDAPQRLDGLLNAVREQHRRNIDALRPRLGRLKGSGGRVQGSGRRTGGGRPGEEGRARAEEESGSGPSPAPQYGTHTQISALLAQRGSLSNGEAQAALGVAGEAARRLLQRLVDDGVAAVVGQRRGTRYVWRR